MSQMSPPQSMQDTMPPRRTGSLGCLGAFSVFCLLLFSTLEAGALMWMNPDWFDRHAFWRGPVIQAEPLYVSDAKSRQLVAQANTADDAKWANATLEVTPPRPPKAMEFARISTSYVPQSSATLKGNGFTATLPPGSVREAAEISAAPMMSVPAEVMNAPIGGPIYEMRIGGQEHYNFAKPVQMTLPYLPEMAKLAPAGSQPKLAVWENGRWRALPSSVDPTTNTVTASVPHASWFTVLVSAASSPITARTLVTRAFPIGALGFFVFYQAGSNATIRGTAREWLWNPLSKTYKTPEGNFKIHYFTSYDDAVVTDPKYSLAAGRPSGAVPLFVQDVGIHLERTFKEFRERGFPLPPADYLRYDVFLLKSSDWGESPCGGPIFVTADMPNVCARGNYDLEKVLRATCAHELMHVVQGSYTNPIPGAWNGWYYEMSAGYVGDWIWKELGKPTDMVDACYGVGRYRLFETPMDQTPSPACYNYSSFLRAIDVRHPGGGVTFIKTVKGNPGPLDMETAMRGGMGGLSSLFVEAAQEYYHGDLFRGEVTPTIREKDQSVTNWTRGQLTLRTRGGTPLNDFLLVNQELPGSEGQVRVLNPWSMGSIKPMPHLTASAVYVRSTAAQPLRKPKLVVCVTPRTEIAAPGIQLFFAENKLPEQPVPNFAHSRGTYRTADVKRPQTTFVAKNFGVDSDLVTMVAVNSSPDKDQPGMEVERWLLLAPTYVSFDRENKNQWKITWPRAELKDYPQVFGGYAIYRRKETEPETAFKHVATVKDVEFCLDSAPDMGNWVYTVRVLDRLGNESESPATELSDPFVGTWYGTIKLIEGSLAEPMIAGFRKSGDEADARNVAKLDALKKSNPAEYATQKAQYDTLKAKGVKIRDAGEQLLRLAEQFAKAGVLLKYTIVENKGRYFLQVREVMWKELPAEDQPRVELFRVDANSLRANEMPEGFPPLVLRLHRKEPASKHNEIYERGIRFKGSTEAKIPGGTVGWRFWRQSSEQVKGTVEMDAPEDPDVP